jgi:hypothetical protein
MASLRARNGWLTATRRLLTATRRRLAIVGVRVVPQDEQHGWVHAATRGEPPVRKPRKSVAAPERFSRDDSQAA